MVGLTGARVSKLGREVTGLVICETVVDVRNSDRFTRFSFFSFAAMAFDHNGVMPEYSLISA